MRQKAKTRKRSPGWIGTRVTVCGQRIYTDGDLICLLPPGHTPTHIHATMAFDTQTNTPVMCVQDEEKEELQWLSPRG